MSPNYLGTQSGLTGIPSLLISGLQQIEDQTTQTALYQVQNWANSFFTWNFATFNGTYLSGGVTVAFDRPFATDIFAFVANPYFAVGGASQAAATLLELTAALVVLWNPAGTQIANGTTVQFSYIAVGH